jgi:predicted secreted protein
MKILVDRLKDQRSHKILFVSHCILNENARYLGGAFQPGIIEEKLDEFRKLGYGLVQIVCPEQKAWGGVLKPYLWLIVGLKKSFLFHFRKLIFILFLWNTKRIYRKIAQDVVLQIQNYQKADFEVVGFLGLGGSPTCGVFSTLDLSKYELLADLDVNNIERESFNTLLYSKFSKIGKGLFSEILYNELKRKKMDIPFMEYDIPSEMKKYSK